VRLCGNSLLVQRSLLLQGIVSAWPLVLGWASESKLVFEMRQLWVGQIWGGRFSSGLDLDRLDEAVKVRAEMEVNKTAIATINVNTHLFKIFPINNLSNFTRTNYSPQGMIFSFGRTFKKHTVL
jgi:hypothetical protein